MSKKLLIGISVAVILCLVVTGAVFASHLLTVNSTVIVQQPIAPNVKIYSDNLGQNQIIDGSAHSWGVVTVGNSITWTVYVTNTGNQAANLTANGSTPQVDISGNLSIPAQTNVPVPMVITLTANAITPSVMTQIPISFDY